MNRTERFASRYFQNVLSEWNLLATNIKESNTLEAFKSKLPRVIRPTKKSVYNFYNITCISPLTEHRFRHSFDCLSPRCACGEDNENDVHFFLRCPLYDLLRSSLFSQLPDVPGLNITRMNTRELCDLLLYGDPKLNVIANKIIIEATL